MSNDGKAFTISPSFNDIKQLIDDLHNPNLPYNLNFIATIIPAFKSDPSYKYTQLLIGNNSGILECDPAKGLWKGTNRYG